MSERQVVIQRLFDEVINAGHLEVADEVLDPGFVDHGPMGETPGVDAFKALTEQWLAGVPDVHCAVEDYFEAGDMAAWNIRVTGTQTGEMMGMPPSGKRFEYVTPNIARFSGNRPVEHWADQG